MLHYFFPAISLNISLNWIIQCFTHVKFDVLALACVNNGKFITTQRGGKISYLIFQHDDLHRLFLLLWLCTMFSFLNLLKTQFFFIEQNSPGWQKHRKPSSWSTQIPWIHGDDSHSFKLCWHSGPANPVGHSHLNGNVELANLSCVIFILKKNGKKGFLLIG